MDQDRVPMLSQWQKGARRSMMVLVTTLTPLIMVASIPRAWP